MKKILILFLGCVTLGACTDNHGAKTEAQKVVLKYLLAGTAEARAPYILNPQEELPRMQKMYENTNASWKDRSFKFTAEKSLPQGVLVVVEDGTNKAGYLLFPEGNSLKIIWSLSMFMNEQFPTGDNLKKMRLDMDRDKHPLFVSAKPVVSYLFEFEKKNRQDIYAFELRDASKTVMTGFCYKNNSNCKELFDKLKENSECIVSLDAWYPDRIFWEDTVVGYHAEIGNIKIQSCFIK